MPSNVSEIYKRRPKICIELQKQFYPGNRILFSTKKKMNYQAMKMNAETLSAYYQMKEANEKSTYCMIPTA